LAAPLKVKAGSAALEVRRSYQSTNGEIAQVTISTPPSIALSSLDDDEARKSLSGSTAIGTPLFSAIPPSGSTSFVLVRKLTLACSCPCEIEATPFRIPDALSLRG